MSATSSTRSAPPSRAASASAAVRAMTSRSECRHGGIVAHRPERAARRAAGPPAPVPHSAGYAFAISCAELGGEPVPRQSGPRPARRSGCDRCARCPVGGVAHPVEALALVVRDRRAGPSDSPGGLTQTYASMSAAGVARGRSPSPAPDWLHQLPAWIRRSMRDWSTKVLTSGEELAAGRPPGAAPAVAGRVDQHADAGVEADRYQLAAERLGERQLLDVVVPVHPPGLPHRRAVHRRADGEVRLDQRRVVRRVGDEAVHRTDVAGRPGRLEHDVGGGTEVRVPADPAVVRGVEVVVDVGDGAELAQGVPDALHVAAVLLHRGAGRRRSCW